MRLKIYNFLVNKHPGICDRYHAQHDGAVGIKSLLSPLYLLWLNFAYYVLFCKWLGKKAQLEIFEEKSLDLNVPESQQIKIETQEALIQKLLKYDVISFDIFDTLVFRPFCEPSDLFFIIGQKLGYMDFKRIRKEGELKTRLKKYKVAKTYEVNLDEIWTELSAATGIDKKTGMDLEVATELEFCYANPYMKPVFDGVVKAGKHVIITSDMYLPGDILDRMLKNCGYQGYEKLYVSNEYEKSKAKGDLYTLVKEELCQKYGQEISFVHVGDNENSDVNNAKANGFTPIHYPNVNTNSLLYRTYDISPIIGGAYRGIVNNHLYNGTTTYNFNQEYGFIYGGLFILGYCSFIHRYVKEHAVDKLLFLSRDGEILKKVYDYLYPKEPTEYVYVSRLAAAKWAAKYQKYDYLRKLVYHKVGLGKTFSDILKEMELSELTSKLEQDEKLTPDNVEKLIGFINTNWDKILEIYKPQVDAAGDWYREVVGDAKNAVAVDIGWAGSGALALKTLFENEWNIDCKLTGIVAGTNTALNSEPDMSETMLLDGSLVSYLYSSGTNRDIWKKHNPALDYNLYFELITSSPSPSFKGFYYDENKNIVKQFSEAEANPEGIEDIWTGIMDFAREYKEHFGTYDFLFNISGRDAYAPMLLAASNDEKYLKKIYRDFDLKVSVE